MSTKSARPRILLVEDEDSISDPFSRVLAREGFEPVVAKSVDEALRLAASVDPELVLLDLMLPDGDGRDVCRELRRRSETPIIMVTARGTETDRIVGLELGADDYVVKPFSGPEVIARIRAVLRRTRRDGDGAQRLDFGDLVIDVEARRVYVEGDEVELSRKEFDLLVALAEAAGRVLTRDFLMERVWDENWFGPTKTLDVHIGTLRKKLGEDTAKPRYIHTVRGVGFRFATHEELRS